MKKETKIIAVNKNTNCVRTVLPNAMAELLNIKAGDTINWELKTKDGAFYLEVRKGA